MFVTAKKSNKKWMQHAVRSPGALHRQMGVPEGETIGTEKIQAKLNALKKKKGKDGKYSAKDLQLVRRLNFALRASKAKKKKKADFIEQLFKQASALDRLGLYEEAASVDELIRIIIADSIPAGLSSAPGVMPGNNGRNADTETAVNPVLESGSVDTAKEPDATTDAPVKKQMVKEDEVMDAYEKLGDKLRNYEESPPSTLSAFLQSGNRIVYAEPPNPSAATATPAVAGTSPADTSKATPSTQAVTTTQKKQTSDPRGDPGVGKHWCENPTCTIKLDNATGLQYCEKHMATETKKPAPERRV